MATHSSILARRIPGMAEPGGLLSMGSHRVGHRGEAKDSALLSSRDAGLLEPPERPQVGPAVTRAPPPAFPRNPRGRLGPGAAREAP